MTLSTIPSDVQIQTEYCDCARTSSGDLWRCENPGSRCRQDGKGCALTATLTATGRDRWSAAVEVEIKARPCPCGRPKTTSGS